MRTGCSEVRSVKQVVTMPDTPTPEPFVQSATKPPSKLRRIAWFVGLWVVSVLALTVVSKLIRWAIMP